MAVGPINITGLDKGAGIGVLEGKLYRVEQTVPGDVVMVDVVHIGQKAIQAKVLELITPSTRRSQAACPWVEQGCGACALGLWRYRDQCQQKVQRVKAAFEQHNLPWPTGVQFWPQGHEACELDRENPFDDVHEIVGAFRNKAIYYVDDRGQLGHVARGSREVVVGTHACPQVPSWMHQASVCLMEAAQGQLHAWGVVCLTFRDGALGDAWAQASQKLAMVLVKPGQTLATWQARLSPLLNHVDTLVVHEQTQANNRVWGQRLALWGKPTLTTHYLGTPFSFDESTFLQVNGEQTQRLYSLAIKRAQLTQDDIALDLYSGVGTLGLLMAPEVQHVLGIERVSQSVACARQTASLLNRHNTIFLSGDVGEVLQEQTIQPTVAMIDPAYSGMDARALDAVAKQASLTRLVYIACSPEALARDASLLCQAGFTLTHLDLVDLFAGTDHIESVARLARNP